ncbi:MAG: hypothetical protein Q8O30_07460 [Candidatus Omnitrophota bacterium]|nr:hypothetical protein [Candidatus Omnitrophota bacterium]
MRQDNQTFYRKIRLPFALKRPILAFGSQTKNTLCFAKGNFAYLSRLHPDLSTPRDFSKFEKDAKYFLKKNPKIIAYDLHPEYQSTKYVQSSKFKVQSLQSIQHHHAHIASCMADNGLKNQKVIGVAFDGTGLGDDGRIWGAEFLVCDYKNFTRCAHLKEIPLVGQDMAILEPWRLAAIWLYRIYKERFLNLGINFVKGINKKEWQVLKNMYLSDFNSPLAGSMGRLFDAVASLVLAKYKVKFEAELAMELEKIATGYRLQAAGYKFQIIKSKDKYILDPSLMFKEIISDLKARQAKEKIAYRFHLTVAEMAREMCIILRKETRINKVVLSGGVFQNNLLLSLILDLLYKKDFQVFAQKNLSCNDSAISLGQAAIANFGG